MRIVRVSLIPRDKNLRYKLYKLKFYLFVNWIERELVPITVKHISREMYPRFSPLSRFVCVFQDRFEIILVQFLLSLTDWDGKQKKKKKREEKEEGELSRKHDLMKKIRTGNSEFVFLSKLKDRDGKQLEENRGNFMAAARLEDIRFPVKGERKREREITLHFPNL